jgi:hypothetical protein
MDRDDRELAAEALGLTGRRDELAARLVTPRWYHPVAGLAIALVVASFATRNGFVVLAAAVLYVASLIALPRLYRRATGVWVSGVPHAATRTWGRRLGWSGAAGVLLGLVSSFRPFLWPLGAVAAVAVFVATQLLGKRFDAALRAELLADPDAVFRIEDDR